MSHTTRRQLCTCLAIASFALSPLSVQAQLDTSRPITIIVPYPAGGLTDLVAREIAAAMGQSLKASVVVDNRPGGASQIAMNALKNAPADGHTLVVADSTTLSVNTALYKKLSYDPRTDILPLTELVVAPSLLVVPPTSPYKTLQDLLDAARRKGEGLNYATQGPGQGSHLFGAGLGQLLGVKLNPIHYRGSAPGLMDTMSGQVDFMYDAIGSSGPFVKSGKLRALGVGGTEQRIPAYPDIPTLNEQGLTWLVPRFWWGAVVKTGTPPAIADTLRRAVTAALQEAAIAKKFTDQGILIKTSTTPELQAYIASEVAHYVKVVKETGITVD